MTTPTQELKDALGTVLKDDSDVQSYLDTFNGEAAIFTGREVPETGLDPYARIPSPFSSPHQNEFSNKKSNPTKPFIDIRVLAKKGPTSNSLEKASDAIYNAVHDEPKKLTDEMPNMACMKIKAEGPVNGGEDEEYEARVVTISANLSDPDS